MTREETINVLQNEANCEKLAVCALNCDLCEFFVTQEQVLTAHEMAISALRQQGVPGKDVGNNDPLTLDDAIAHLDDTLSDTGRKWSCESCRMEHVQLRAWLAELRDIKQERNAPLTLAELRKMGGEPVWIKLFDPDEEFWVLRNEWVDTRNPEPMILFHMRWYSHADYGKTWLAYRQKPEEDDCEH